MFALGARRLATPSRSEQITAVRAFFDLTADAAPVRLQRGVALDQRLKTEPKRGVPWLDFAQLMKRAVELLARDLWLDALDPLKPLLIKMLDARKLHLCIRQPYFELFRRHDPTITAV
ncbi:MAG: hypothetical protein JRD92_10395 [Deltaproteobacteria bacterium]|nr:hypothetical protein [Deltaproteobacteria bacterium]